VTQALVMQELVTQALVMQELVTQALLPWLQARNPRLQLSS
jgi:hypothetical protein